MIEESTNCMQLAKKCPKITLGAISFFLGSKTLYKKQDEAHKLFLEDLMLFTVKRYFPLSTLLEKILSTMIAKCLNLYLQHLLDVTPTTTITFDLWMNRGQQDTFAFVITCCLLIGSLNMS
jgi:hypothetical protein